MNVYNQQGKSTKTASFREERITSRIYKVYLALISVAPGLWID